MLGPLETLAFAASGRARVSKCWGLWQGARLKTRLLASRKELAETKSELKLARVNLAKAERQLRRQQSATSAVSSVKKKTREESRRPRAKWNLKACLNFKRLKVELKETLLAVLTLLAEYADSVLDLLPLPLLASLAIVLCGLFWPPPFLDDDAADSSGFRSATNGA